MRTKLNSNDIQLLTDRYNILFVINILSIYRILEFYLGFIVVN